VEGKDVATAVDEGRKAGYFMTGSVAVRCFSEEKIASAMIRLAKKGPAPMILSITERCNLRCRYCSFSGSYEDNLIHGTKEMPLDVFEKAVRWNFSFPDRNASSIAFYGGEPLGSLALISRAAYLARSLSPAPIQFHLTTNGTLFNPEICEGERNRLDWIIREYTAIREENNDAFFWRRDLTGKLLSGSPSV
jgi:MoaA/NifB/PqqE/SkfB family radical SAM enzyme